MLWNYIRTKTREAFLGGIADAVLELEAGAADGPVPLAPVVDDLLARLRRQQAALPAPDHTVNGTEEPMKPTRTRKQP